MSNLASAKIAIEAEIAHAKEGLAHFYSRVEALEKTLFHLIGVDGGVLDAHSQGTETVVKALPKSAKTKATGKPKRGKTAKGGNALPFTGGDFWIDLVTSRPQSATEILHAAIDSLGFAPSKEQVQKLVQRSTFALNTLVKTKKIQDSGKGRERRFFKS